MYICTTSAPSSARDHLLVRLSKRNAIPACDGGSQVVAVRGDDVQSIFRLARGYYTNLVAS